MTSMTYEWRGEIYTGLKAVSQATGKTRQAISQHLDRHGNLDRLQPDAEKISHNMPYWIGGRVYPSKATIARIIGVDPWTVQRWTNEGQTARVVEALREARA